MDGRSGLSLRGRLSCHCLLVETSAGLVLVDTGLGLHDVAHARPRLSPFFLALVRPELASCEVYTRYVEDNAAELFRDSQVAAHSGMTEPSGLAGAKVDPRDPLAVTLNVNGCPCHLALDVRTTLLDALRDRLLV